MIYAILLILGCSISNHPPSKGSKEEQIREQLLTIEQLASELETPAFQIESYTDEIRRAPNNDAHQKELKQQLKTLTAQYDRFQAEISSWEENLKASEE
jgi:hypothetical protein